MCDFWIVHFSDLHIRQGREMNLGLEQRINAIAADWQTVTCDNFLPDLCVVTGDVGNWMFCREFHPSSKGHVSDYYWVEKLQMSSSQILGRCSINPHAARLKKRRKSYLDFTRRLQGCSYIRA